MVAAVTTPDFDTYPIEHTIVSAEARERWVQVDWSDGRVSHFHHMWLRDNCPCTECVHQGTKEQMFELVSVSPNVHAISAHVSQAGSLAVAWSEMDHTSEFHPGWLRSND